MQSRRPDTRVLLTKFRIQRQQLGGNARQYRGSFLAYRLRLRLELRQCGIAGGDQITERVHHLITFGSELIQVTGSIFEPLHDLKLGVFQLVLPARESGHLMLKRLKILGGGDSSRIESLLITGRPLADLFDVGVRLGLKHFDVRHLGLGCHDQRRQIVLTFRGLIDGCVFRKRAGAMCELVQPRVVLLKFKEAQLGGVLGVQSGLLPPGACIAHGSVTVEET